MVLKWSNSELYLMINTHLIKQLHPFLKHPSLLLSVLISSEFFSCHWEGLDKYFLRPLYKAAMTILNLVQLQASGLLHSFKMEFSWEKITWLPKEKVTQSLEKANNTSLTESHPRVRAQGFGIRHGITLRPTSSSQLSYLAMWGCE